MSELHWIPELKSPHTYCGILLQDNPSIARWYERPTCKECLNAIKGSKYNMNKKKAEKLTKAGWQVGSAEDFLNTAKSSKIQHEPRRHSPPHHGRP